MSNSNPRIPILKFLNEDSIATYDINTISKEFPEWDKLLLKRILKILEQDGLVYRDQETENNLENINIKEGVPSSVPVSPIFRISLEGIRFLEDNSPEDEFSESERENMEKHLDEFGERLRKLELGQQIIYDDIMTEIEELKSLLTVLGKKNWKEVFKGKLVDLGLATLTKEAADIIKEVFGSDSTNLLTP